MSEVDATIVTMNDTCYKCEQPLGYDAKDSVHPLCDFCEDDFMDWLRSQV